MREAGLVVVGASLAGLRAVQGARNAGFTGPVTLIGAEEHLPYDRPPLSKAFLDPSEPGTPPLAGADTLDELGVDVRLGHPATALCLDDREVIVAGKPVPFDSLVLATGCAPIPLPGCPAIDGVHTLRTVEDAVDVRRHVLAGSRTVLVGAGFIGAEIATALRSRDAHVTIVEAAELPLVRAVGEQMAPAVAGLHARAGVDLRCGVSVQRISESADGKQVELSDGSVLAADFVLIGIGARPATGWLADSGLPIADGVICDETLQVAHGIYAAGDLARWHNPLFDTVMRLENWTAAAELGAAAGRHAANPAAAAPVATVPYFWSDWYGSRIQVVGVAAAEQICVVGNVEDDTWVALYRAGDRVVGALTLNQRGRIMKYRAMIARQAPWTDARELADAFARA